MTIQQKIIGFFLRHPEAFVWMVSEFYAFKTTEIRKHFKNLDIRLLSNNYYCAWDADTINLYKHELDWNLFSVSCRNFGDVQLIDQFADKIVLEHSDNCDECVGLVFNPKIPWTKELIAKYEHQIDFINLSCVESVPWTESLIDRFLNRWDWSLLSFQANLPWSEQLLAKYEDHWDWGFIEMNENIPWTVTLVDKYFHRFDHLGNSEFERNPTLISDVEIIEEFSDHLSWYSISKNSKLPWLEMNLLERWKDKIDWRGLSLNDFFLPETKFFESNLDKWMTDPVRSFHALSYSETLPWSISMIERFISYWDWDILSRNEGLPWSSELIDRFIDSWKWGSFEPCEDDANSDCGERGLIGNSGIPWDIDLIIRYEEYIDIEKLQRDWFIWDKVFKGTVDEKMVEVVMRLI